MATEYVVGDSIVPCLLIKAPAPPATSPSAEPWFQSISQRLRTVCLPKVNVVKLFAGQAYHPVYANNLDPKYSCSWTNTGDGGGRGQIVLAWADQPRLRVTVKVKFVVAKDGSKAWLTVEYNPTTLKVGNNVHPAAFIDPTTGVIDNCPSSNWAAMTRDFHLGFAFLEAMSETGSLLFDADTRLVIERGHFHLERVQYAAAKDVPNVTDFLQVGTVIYGQTKARGRGIGNNAKDLGLSFKPYAHPDPDEERLSGFTLQKKHGQTLHVSVLFYDKLVRQQQVHQAEILSLVEAQTVDQSVREDITAHSSFIQYIAEAAQKKLRRMSAADRKFFDLISPEEFLQGTPQPTVWWLQRAIYLLSHRRVQGRWLRYSFATWLVPFVEQQLLHFDVVASITTEGYYALLALNDPVAVAWRSDPTPGAGDWAGRLARIAGCTRSTVYNRRDEWRQTYGIDIARPLQLYSDILYYGHNSIAKPESITALMVAVDQEDGDEAVRLHAEAIADFERKRVEIVNPALVRRPRAMELKLPAVASPVVASPVVASPVVASPEPNDPDDLEFTDLDDVDLIETVPARPVSVAPSAANSHASQVRPGRAQESRTSIVLRTVPPPPTGKKLVLPAMRCPPPPPPTGRIVLLRRTPPPPLPLPTGRIVLRARRTPPPPPPPLPTGRIVLRARRTPPPPPPPLPTERIVLLRRSPPPPTTRRATPDK